jgi:ankyrin repeat protein
LPCHSQPLHHAAAADCAALVTALVAAGADANRATSSGTPLHWAAGEGASAAAAALLASGADANAVDDDGMPPLLLAVASGHAGIVQMLLDAGADAARAALPGGVTLLHVAADVGEPRSVAALLACARGRALARARDAEGATPRDVAAAAGDAALCALFDAAAAGGAN